MGTHRRTYGAMGTCGDPRRNLWGGGDSWAPLTPILPHRLRVRGQHTKTTGRRGRTVGVSKKK
uniref:Uncharacterized protein n=1 Tax=Meleagris gallopavo TaxID=9103 RepID=A0A803XU79_MELGA